MELFEKVLNPENEEWLKGILKRAYEKVEYFNYENSKARYLAALKESVDRGGYKWLMKNG